MKHLDRHPSYYFQLLRFFRSVVTKERRQGKEAGSEIWPPDPSVASLPTRIHPGLKMADRNAIAQVTIFWEYNILRWLNSNYFINIVLGLRQQQSLSCEETISPGTSQCRTHTYRYTSALGLCPKGESNATVLLIEAKAVVHGRSVGSCPQHKHALIWL